MSASAGEKIIRMEQKRALVHARLIGSLDHHIALPISTTVMLDVLHFLIHFNFSTITSRHLFNHNAFKERSCNNYLYLAISALFSVTYASNFNVEFASICMSTSNVESVA